MDIRAALAADTLTDQQRALVADVLLAAEALAHLERDEYAAQDAAVARVRETWTRLADEIGA